MYIVKGQLGILKLRFDLAEQQMIVNATVTSVHDMDIGIFNKIYLC